jgi:TonB family protein
VKDLQKSLSISILVHILILSAVCSTWINKPAQRRTISLNFSLINFETHGDSAGTQIVDRHTGHEAAVKRGNKVEKPNATQGDIETKTTGPAAYHSSFSPPIADGTTGNVSDKDGQVEITGKKVSSTEFGEPGLDTSSLAKNRQSSGGGQNVNSEGRTIRYGSGSAYEKSFNYIREDILKNVRYPEKARRNGLQGKITLSFTVTETGLTRDVKVVNGSGFSELDNSAKEAITRTTFSQKIPYKLFVILPIEYRLE